jgi:hypothetical protein
MTNWKSKYLEMKLKYINEKQKAGGYFGPKNIKCKDAVDWREVSNSYWNWVLSTPEALEKVDFLVPPNTSAYGYIVVITFSQMYNDLVNRPFINCLRQFDGKPMKSVVIKIQQIGGQAVHGSQPVTEREFNKEADTQKEIFHNTIQNNQPICPAVYVHKVLSTNHNMIKRLQRIATRNLSQKIQELRNRTRTIGLIFMEHDRRFGPLQDIDRSELPRLNPMIMETVQRLHASTGYLHGDLHHGNILVAPNLVRFYNSPGAILLIDFGRAQKINAFLYPKASDHMKEEVKKPRGWNLRLNQIHWAYAWMAGDYQYVIEVNGEAQLRHDSRGNITERYNKKAAKLKTERINNYARNIGQAPKNECYIPSARLERDLGRGEVIEGVLTKIDKKGRLRHYMAPTNSDGDSVGVTPTVPVNATVGVSASNRSAEQAHTPFSEGSSVIVDGLVSRPELNRTRAAASVGVSPTVRVNVSSDTPTLPPLDQSSIIGIYEYKITRDLNSPIDQIIEEAKSENRAGLLYIPNIINNSFGVISEGGDPQLNGTLYNMQWNAERGLLKGNFKQPQGDNHGWFEFYFKRDNTFWGNFGFHHDIPHESESANQRWVGKRSNLSLDAQALAQAQQQAEQLQAQAQAQALNTTRAEAPVTPGALIQQQAEQLQAQAQAQAQGWGLPPVYDQRPPVANNNNRAVAPRRRGAKGFNTKVGVRNRHNWNP